MRILRDSEISAQNFKGSVVTIGNFDGVHRGHAEIFRHLKERGRQLGLPAIAVTFEPHPLAVLAPALTPPLITTFEQKCGLIADAGIDFLAAITFTQEFARIPAEEFVLSILCDSLHMRHIIIGHDYAFGKDRGGNFETLENMKDKCGFTLEDLDPVGENDHIFSSSLVRRFLGSGDMRSAADVLGRYYAVSGHVVHGRDIGHKLGFPTANIMTRNELIPPDGVYAVMAFLDGVVHKGACSIGTNPTFGDSERTIEVFLLDFSGQLYDHHITLCFVQRLRGVIKFPDVAELVKAIEQDVAATRLILDSIDQDMLKPLVKQEMADQ